MKIAKLNGEPEIFKSIQGEGLNTGTPCVFIRTSQCNLFCHWCDTDYTWNFTNTQFKHRSDQKVEKQENQVVLSPLEVAEIAVTYNTPHYVLTGGEPMLQQLELVELIQSIQQFQPEAFFEIETNGTFAPIETLDALVDQYNVSLKLENSQVPASLRLKKKVIEAFSKNSRAFFKFVINGSEDLIEVIRLTGEYEIPAKRVFLMPEAMNKKSLELKQHNVFKLALWNGFQFSDRLHVRLYDGAKGV